MRWPRNLPPVQWPGPLLSEHGYPMRISQETKDLAYAMGNAEFRRMQVRGGLGDVGCFGRRVIVLTGRQKRR